MVEAVVGAAVTDRLPDAQAAGAARLLCGGLLALRDSTPAHVTALESPAVDVAVLLAMWADGAAKLTRDDLTRAGVRCAEVWSPEIGHGRHLSSPRGVFAAAVTTVTRLATDRRPEFAVEALDEIAQLAHVLAPDHARCREVARALGAPATSGRCPFEAGEVYFPMLGVAKARRDRAHEWPAVGITRPGVWGTVNYLRWLEVGDGTHPVTRDGSGHRAVCAVNDPEEARGAMAEFVKRWRPDGT